MARLVNFRQLVAESLGNEDPLDFKKYMKKRMDEIFSDKIADMITEGTLNGTNNRETLIEDNSVIMQEIKAGCIGLGAQSFDADGDSFKVVVPKNAAEPVLRWLDESDAVDSYVVDNDFTKEQGGSNNFVDQSSEWDQDCTISGYLKPDLIDYGTIREELNVSEDDDNYVFEAITAFGRESSSIQIVEEDGKKFRVIKPGPGREWDADKQEIVAITENRALTAAKQLIEEQKNRPGKKALNG